jgi:hypothetical protein
VINFFVEPRAFTDASVRFVCEAAYESLDKVWTHGVCVMVVCSDPGDLYICH